MLLVSACGWYRQALAVANPKKKRKAILEHRRTIGEALRLNRKNAGFTQETLAEVVGLNPKYIGEIERGEKIISIEALMRIAKAVKTPLRDFFKDV